MTKYLRPKLIAFQNTERVGYPSMFSEYHENEWKNKEEYDKAVAEGKMIGGGPEKWEEVLNEIIFAFDWFASEEGLINNFYEKWNLEDPHKEVEKNKLYSYWYDLPDGGALSTATELSKEEREKRGAIFKNKSFIHFDIKKHMEYGERAQKGFELFGKHFMSFWD